MNITIRIKNKEVLPRLYKVLRQFSENEIEIEEPLVKKGKKYTDKYIEKNWKKLIYTSVGNFDCDDDEYLRMHYGEKLLKDYEDTF
jgi:hypothetical protein